MVLFCYTSLMETLEKSASKDEGVLLDPHILESLRTKYKDYFDEYNQIIEVESGGTVKDYLTPEMELLPYFKDLELRGELLQDKTILDIGSQAHFFDDYCKQKYNSVVVVVDIEMSSMGTKHDLPVVADARALPFKDSSFDLIVSHASMPHILVPYADEKWNFIPLEGETKQKAINDVLRMLREVYRVTKNGGQIRMSTFSENEEMARAHGGEYSDASGILSTGEVVPIDGDESLYQTLTRINLVKEALLIFEKESGAQCIFKDEVEGGLIIVIKG